MLPTDAMNTLHFHLSNHAIFASTIRHSYTRRKFDFRVDLPQVRFNCGGVLCEWWHEISIKATHVYQTVVIRKLGLKHQYHQEEQNKI